MSVPSRFQIRELPRGERPRERLREHGAQALSTSEFLAIIIGAGTTRRSALGVAHDILARSHGSLRRLSHQPLGALTAVDGVGTVRALMIQAALELGRRQASEVFVEGIPLRAPRDIYEIYAPRLEDLPIEEFHVGILDAQHRLDRDVLITRGILNSSLVHPREIFREAIAERASAIILIHNHPSGDPTPSRDDIVVTGQLVAAGKLLGLPIHDHVIVGRGRYVSFAECQLLAENDE